MHFAGLDRLGLLGITSFGAVTKGNSATQLVNAVNLNTNVGSSSSSPTKGTCTPDGQFIWDIATDGSLFLRRLRVGEVCTMGTSGSNPTVRQHNGDGSVTVTNPDGSTYTIPPVVTTTLDARTLKAEHIARATLASQVSALNAKALIASGLLAPCDPSTYVSGGGPNLYACYAVSNEQLGLPPLTFVAGGSNVVFTVGELIKDQGFKRDYVPNDDQSFWTAWALYNTSKSILMDQYAAAAAQQLLTGGNNADFTDFKNKINNPSISMFIGMVHDANTSLPGFAWNPPTPTNSEMNDYGGLNAWLNRGGWLISYSVASGQTRLGDAWVLGVATNLPCACQTNRIEPAENIALKIDFTLNGFAASWPMGYVNGDGNISTGVGDPNNPPTWETYIDIVSNPSMWHCEVRHQDPSWYTKVATVLAGVLQSIAQIFCAAGPSFTQGLNTLAAEKCIDKNNKPCKKGTTGCTCVTPPSATTIGVGLTSWWISQWCQDFKNEVNSYTNPTSELPVAPPGSISTTIVPSWIIWLGLVATAGVLYKYNQAPAKPVAKPKPLLPPAP